MWSCVVSKLISADLSDYQGFWMELFIFTFLNSMFLCICSPSNMRWPYGILRLLHCSTWNHWDGVPKELQYSGHGLCKHSLAPTSSQKSHFGCKCFFKPSLCLDAGQYRLYVRLHVPWWPGVRWRRRLYQWNQLSMSAQWTGLLFWTDTDCGLQHLVRTVTHWMFLSYTISLDLLHLFFDKQ